MSLFHRKKPALSVVAEPAGQPDVAATAASAESPVRTFPLETLKKLQIGMSAKDVRSLIGEPDFINSAEDAMRGMFGAGQVIGGEALLARQSGKEYWLYHVGEGNFQMLMDAGHIKAFSGLDYQIKKLTEEAQE